MYVPIGALQSQDETIARAKQSAPMLQPVAEFLTSGRSRRPSGRRD